MAREPELLPCPFCGGTVQPRDALWPSEGDSDAVIHAEPTDCPMVQFSNDTADKSVYARWNVRAALAAIGSGAGRDAAIVELLSEENLSAVIRALPSCYQDGGAIRAAFVELKRRALASPEKDQ